MSNLLRNGRAGLDSAPRANRPGRRYKRGVYGTGRKALQRDLPCIVRGPVQGQMPSPQGLHFFSLTIPRRPFPGAWGVNPLSWCCAKLRICSHTLSVTFPPAAEGAFLSEMCSAPGLPELSNPARSEVLGLGENQLSGIIYPRSWGTCPILEGCGSTTTRLTGAIPEELGKSGNLERRYLGNNQLSGCAPGELRCVGRTDLGQRPACPSVADDRLYGRVGKRAVHVWPNRIRAAGVRRL